MALQSSLLFTAISNTLLSTTLLINFIESRTETPAPIKIPNVLLNLLKIWSEFSWAFFNGQFFNNVLF